MKNELYRSYDQEFYYRYLDGSLPPVVLDFHAHTWRREDFRNVPWESGQEGGRYMVVRTQYPLDELLADGSTLFPDRSYQAVCFGMPTPAADIAGTNAYLADVRNNACFPLMIMGSDRHDTEGIRRDVIAGGFWGYKVYLPWFGNDYGDIRVWDLFSEESLQVADEMRLVILLHVPGSDRLAHPRTQAEVRDLAKRYPSAQFVLAHCGRCYMPRQMLNAIDAVKDVENVYFDTSMVMDPAVLSIVFQRMDSRRVLFGTDLPVPMMRGSRVSIGTHWVDVVLDEGYPPSGYRVASNDFQATFMAYEIVNAILVAGEIARLSSDEISQIFYDNGKAVLDRVRREPQSV